MPVITNRKMIKHITKAAIICLSLLSLSLLERFHGNLQFSRASANNAVATKTGTDLSALVQAENYFGEFGLKNAELYLMAQNATDSTAEDSITENSETNGSSESGETEVKTTPDENANDDYYVPKTVYIGVDSVASPDVIPQVVTSPESTDPTDSSQATVDEQPLAPSAASEISESIVETQAVESTVSSEPANSSAARVEEKAIEEKSTAPSETISDATQTPSNESASDTTSVEAAQPAQASNSVAATKTKEIIKAPEIQQVKTESMNSVTKRITLFKSIDLTSELGVPTGLPENLNTNQDHRDVANTDDSQNTQDELSDSDNQLAKIEDDSEQAESQTQAQEQVSSDQNVLQGDDRSGAEGVKKPAIVVNINDNFQVNSRNEWGWTKIMSAAIEGNLESVNELLAQGADPDIAGEDGRSPLMAASWNKHYDVVASLVNAGADVDLINRDGWTALSFAAWNGDIVIVQSLLRVAANKNIKTADGFTPLELAEQKGHQKIVELLK